MAVLDTHSHTHTHTVCFFIVYSPSSSPSFLLRKIFSLACLLWMFRWLPISFLERGLTKPHIQTISNQQSAHNYQTTIVYFIFGWTVFSARRNPCSVLYFLNKDLTTHNNRRFWFCSLFDTFFSSILHSPLFTLFRPKMMASQPNKNSHTQCLVRIAMPMIM